MSTARFFKLPADVLVRRDVSSSGKLVYAVILDHARGNSGRAWPGVRRIGTVAGLHVETVVAAIRALEHAGLLTADRGPRGKGTTYTVGQGVRKTRTLSQGEALGKSEHSTRGKVFGKPERGVRKTRTEALGESEPNRQRYEQSAAPSAPSTKTTPGALHAELVAYWTREWSQTVGGGGKCPFHGTRDGRAIKTLLEAVAGDADRARRIIDYYLRDGDEWLRENGADRPLGLLCSSKRLAKYLSQTARPAERADAKPLPHDEHPLIAEARHRWPGDVEERLPEWLALARAGVDYQLVYRAGFDSGAAFRAHFATREDVKDVADAV